MPLKRIYWTNGEKNSAGYPPELPVYALLRAEGIDVVPVVWDRDPIPVLDRGEFLLVRTPWDYLAKLDRFRGWLAELPAARVMNPAKILRWNLEKTYLRELESDGIRLVPTVWMGARSEAEVAEALDGAFPGQTRIVKPVMSAGSHDTYRLAAGEAAPAGRFVGRAAMIQPYLAEIETDGERSLVYFGGALSHAIRKVPRAGDFRVQESHGGRFSEFAPSGVERAFGDSVIAAVRARFPEEPVPLYGRVDYVLRDGVPHLMEAELLEPDLYFHHAPAAAERFVAAVKALPAT